MKRRQFLSTAAAGAVTSFPLLSCNSGNKSVNEAELLRTEVHLGL